MKRKLKVLHLASFHGNIGDGANHSGFKKKILENIAFSLEFTELEIRRFYWGELSFDLDFIKIANQFDLVVIGGGNYFELWVDKSQTGSSIDISLDSLREIKPPILFNMLGVDVGQGTSDKNLNKFKNFIDYLRSDKKYFLSVRNDGALETVGTYLGEKYLPLFHHAPDCGFFNEIDTSAEIAGINFEADQVIGVNLASDMEMIRFGLTQTDARLTLDEFVDSFAGAMNEILREKPRVKIIFFPHIYKDLDIISKVLNRINDNFRRQRVTVAPYSSGHDAQKYIFGLYSRCMLVLGMRFHSNVCSIGRGVPTIGLVNYRQIDKLYGELGLTDSMVQVDKRGFGLLLTSLIDDIYLRYDEWTQKYKDIALDLNTQIDLFHSKVNQWMKMNFMMGNDA